MWPEGCFASSWASVKFGVYTGDWLLRDPFRGHNPGGIDTDIVCTIPQKAYGFSKNWCAFLTETTPPQVSPYNPTQATNEPTVIAIRKPCSLNVHPYHSH